MENTQKVQKTNKKSIFKNNLFVLAIIIVGIVIILSLATDYFFSITNLSAIMTQMALTGILAVGMTFCIITEGVDLSAGNVLSLSRNYISSMSKGGNSSDFSFNHCTMYRRSLWTNNGSAYRKGKASSIYCYLRHDEYSTGRGARNF